MSSWICVFDLTSMAEGFKSCYALSGAKKFLILRISPQSQICSKIDGAIKSGRRWQRICIISEKRFILQREGSASQAKQIVSWWHPSTKWWAEWKSWNCTSFVQLCGGKGWLISWRQVNGISCAWVVTEEDVCFWHFPHFWWAAASHTILLWTSFQKSNLTSPKADLMIC